MIIVGSVIIVGEVGVRFEADTDAETVANLGCELHTSQMPLHRVGTPLHWALGTG